MKIVFSLLAFAIAVLARDVPDNVKSFISRVRSGKCTGGTVLKDGFYSQYPGAKTFAYCQDNETGVIYLHGTGSRLANMDIDCDGDQSDPGDGRCGEGDTQSITAFQYQVQQYSGGQVSDLNANFIPYVVFGNYGSKSGYTTFHPQSHGIKPLSVMAVIYKNQLVSSSEQYLSSIDSSLRITSCMACMGTRMVRKHLRQNDRGRNQQSPSKAPRELNIWPNFYFYPACLTIEICADPFTLVVLGDDGPPMVGEASISLATQFFGTSVTGNNGHDENDIMYIAFPGTIADTVNKSANWGAKNFSTFEASIEDLGNQLIKRLS
jgi:hypothetical protein